MAMELRQQVKMSQQLRLTPQLMQAIKLLQLSRMELINVVQQEMVENPVLEEAQEQGAHDYDIEQVRERPDKERLEEVRVGEDGQAQDKIDWEAFLENYSAPTPGNSYKGMIYDELPGLDQRLSTSWSLTEHLMEQVGLSGMNEEEAYVATLIIGNLDEYGYLLATVEEIAEDANATVEDVEFVLTVVQEFDPLGVAARNLRECLLLQIKKLYPEDNTCRIMVEEHIPNLERKSYSKIAREMGISQDEVLRAARRISTLEPKPGREYAPTDDARYITPDIYIYEVDGEYVPVLNEDGLPKLKISSYYRRELLRKEKDGEKDEAKEYIKNKLKGAMWLIKSIDQRQSTIVKVTESIIKFQRDFFDKGVEHLKPLVLRDVAEDIEMHESTVSRVTTNKYVHTPRGIYELKYFFNSSITNLDGEDLASEAVKAKIRDIIAEEDPAKPFSDARIVEILREQDIDIARRTVAKYREMMGILSSAKRRQVF